MTRGRKPRLDPARSLHIHLDAKLVDEIDRRLWSEAEQRVPKGAYQAFITEAVIRMMRQREVDLSPFAGDLAMPNEHVAYVFPESREFLEQLLIGVSHGNEPGNAEQDRGVEGEG